VIFELVRWRLRWMRPALVLLCMATLAALFAATRADARADRRAEVIVQLRPGTSLAEGRALVRSLGGRVSRELRIINGLGAVVSPAAAGALERDARVHAVSANAQIHTSGDSIYTPSLLQTSFIQSTRTQRLWADYTGATGRGVGVAVVDTGVAGQLPDFRVSASDTRSRVIASAVVNPAAQTATDTYGHGTHVAGLIAGNGNQRASIDPFDSKYVGTAPQANLVSIKISDDAGNASLIDVIDGIQFAVDHKSDYNVRVINLSLNSTVAESYRTDPLDAAVEEAWFSGIVVVTAAGNAGSASDSVSYSPANDPYVISVGAVDDQATQDPLDDLLTSWSSHGTTQDGVRKPEILAPGAHLVSTMAPGAAYTTMCPACLVGTEYMQLGGTSMSSAVVAGIAAGLTEKHPDWTPDQVKGALLHTARDVPGVGVEPQSDIAGKLLNADPKLVSNTGLTPSTLINPATGTLDMTKTEWVRASFRSADSVLSTPWSPSASWRCSICATVDGTQVDPTASWRASWRTTWKASWRTSFSK
jgi:serine protease AprX